MSKTKQTPTQQVKAVEKQVIELNRTLNTNVDRLSKVLSESLPELNTLVAKTKENLNFDLELYLADLEIKKQRKEEAIKTEFENKYAEEQAKHEEYLTKLNNEVKQAENEVEETLKKVTKDLEQQSEELVQKRKEYKRTLEDEAYEVQKKQKQLLDEFKDWLRMNQISTAEQIAAEHNKIVVDKTTFDNMTVSIEQAEENTKAEVAKAAKAAAKNTENAVKSSYESALRELENKEIVANAKISALETQIQDRDSMIQKLENTIESLNASHAQAIANLSSQSHNFNIGKS